MVARTQEMTFWDHLEDLRKTLFRSVGALTAVAVTLFFFKDFLFDDIILAPSHGDFFLYKVLGTDFHLSLVNLEVAAQFMIHIKVTLVCALILTIPYIIYELWRFIAPALYEKEKKALKGAFTFASVLFYVGVAVGFLIIFPLMLNFFVNYQVSADVPNTFSLTSYISLFTSTILTFGLVFEFPTIVAVLSALGIVTREVLKEYRRHAVCAVVVLAALITPSGDPFSLLVVSVPLYVLYEFGILICRKGNTAKITE